MIIRRETRAGSNDLNVAYRPCRIDELVGNDISKKIIRNALDAKKIPHTQLFIGDAGCGKTTAAKIIALGLNCEENGVSSTPCLKCNSCISILEGNSIDVKEINVGQSGGKDHAEAIVKDLPMSPFNSRFKVLIFDEAHKLTDAAKDLLLKPTETGYDHVYFIFCTNQPDKLRNKLKKGGEPFLDRCSVLVFNKLETYQIKDLLKNVCEFEGLNYIQEILDLIAEESKGVPRNALVWLNQVSIENSWNLKAARAICNVISEEDIPRIMDLNKSLLSGSFKDSVAIFDEIKKAASVESVRIHVAGFFVGCLKRAKKVPDARKFSAALDVLVEPIYEQGLLSEHKWYNYMFKVTDIIMVHSNRRQ